MGKLFGRKGDDGNEDSKRSALFGGRSKGSHTASSDAKTQNPYANMPTQSDAYNQAKARAGVPGYSQQDSRAEASSTHHAYADEKKHAQGFQENRYGNATGHGDEQYRASNGPSSSHQYGQAGNGHLRNGMPDESRSALFGGAQDRVERQQAQRMGYEQQPYRQPPPYEDGTSGEVNGYDPNEGHNYQAYGDRQLTAEEEEEEDVLATKQQMKYIKQEDVSSTRNALRLAAQAEEQGMNTLARIGAQGERIHNTEKNLDLTANHTRMAEEKAAELKRLNRSMFAMNVSNPFTASSRRERRDRDILEKHALEREQREMSRREGFQSDQRMQKTFKDLAKEDPNGTAAADRKKSSLAERAKYQFEADSEDDEMENEIDSNLTALGGAAGRMNNLARAIGNEVDEQNRHLVRIDAKSTRVDDQIAMNRARLDRIK